MARSIILTAELDASPETIFEALTTREGLAAFWTPQVSGDTNQGGGIRFGFEAAPVDLEVTVGAADPATRTVDWECHGPWPYWADTSIGWKVVGEQPARVLFSHRGWGEDQPEIEFGSVAFTWAMVLQALKSYAESGVAAPALR